MTREEKEKMSDEAVEVLKGFQMIFPKNYTPPYDGNFTIILGGWRFKLFFDAGGVDYTEELTAPDGRYMDFDDMNVNEEPTLDPLDRLASKHYDIYLELERLLET